MAGEGWREGDGPCLGPEVRGKRLQQAPDLLLAQLYLVIQLPLLNEECGLHLHEVLVVLQLLGGQVVGQDIQHHALPPVQVLLELPCVLVLASQNLPFLVQRTPFLFAGVFTKASEDVLHAGQASRQGQQQVDHLVQVPYEHLVLVKLVGFAELTDQSLHLLSQGIVQLDVREQAPLGFLETLQLVGEASDKLSLEWWERSTN